MITSTQIPLDVWRDFIARHSNGTVFQTPEMFELFQKTKKFDPLIIGAYNDNVLSGLLLGVFIHERSGPAKLLSSRFVIYGGPLLSGDDIRRKECLDTILKALVRQTKNKALFIQFRNFFPQDDLMAVYKKHGFSLIDRLNFVIPLDKREQVLKAMSESRRRQIRLATRNGAQIIEPSSIEQMREFYSILYRLYRFKVRKPLPDWSFFETFYHHAKVGQLGIIKLIQYKGKIIGGILAPIFMDKCIYEWYVCGLDQEYKDQYPSVLATWAGIEYAIDNGIKSFDFMGVGKPDTAYGVRDFKARFGGTLVNNGRITRINKHSLYNIAELGYNVLASFKKI